MSALTEIIKPQKGLHAMSVDVEEYFQVGAFEKHLSKDDWAQCAHRLDFQMSHLLELFDKHSIRATFFTLGWVAEKNPSLIRKMTDAGHELACHGYDHGRVFNFSQKEFREDLIKAKACLEEAAGVAVKGYRAPSFSIRDDCFWAYDVLEEQGFTYSSSLYPIAHDHYGSPAAERVAFLPKEGLSIVEIPPTTLSKFGKNLPVAGGGFFRLFPYSLMRSGMRSAHKQLNFPGNFYFHPWEIDPDQPRVVALPAKSKFRHYVNLSRMFGKLDALCADFEWSTFQDVYFGGEEE
ncbi:DUF3473 domain-containing protein [Temperatibacter marinus]|uniref:Chitooligosaccharide deacetylase n=1 Tax=Temperatibacter marinus TaxID=1456591 RepID=A0AA52HAH4_9PROT|nr:XrtA system polysaccharide deacetylase [Temperatibacter marinus]WND02603.1 DUF3473 domain-containing protein [Temperatibacter marinus]